MVSFVSNDRSLLEALDKYQDGRPHSAVVAMEERNWDGPLYQRHTKIVKVCPPCGNFSSTSRASTMAAKRYPARRLLCSFLDIYGPTSSSGRSSTSSSSEQPTIGSLRHTRPSLLTESTSTSPLPRPQLHLRRLLGARRGRYRVHLPAHVSFEVPAFALNPQVTEADKIFVFLAFFFLKDTAAAATYSFSTNLSTYIADRVPLPPLVHPRLCHPKRSACSRGALTSAALVPRAQVSLSTDYLHVTRYPWKHPI